MVLVTLVLVFMHAVLTVKDHLTNSEEVAHQFSWYRILLLQASLTGQSSLTCRPPVDHLYWAALRDIFFHLGFIFKTILYDSSFQQIQIDKRGISPCIETREIIHAAG